MESGGAAAVAPVVVVVNSESSSSSSNGNGSVVVAGLLLAKQKKLVEEMTLLATDYSALVKSIVGRPLLEEGLMKADRDAAAAAVAGAVPWPVAPNLLGISDMVDAAWAKKVKKEKRASLANLQLEIDTRADKMKALEAETKAKMEEMKAELEAKMEAMEAENKKKMDDMLKLGEDIGEEVVNDVLKLGEGVAEENGTKRTRDGDCDNTSSETQTTTKRAKTKPPGWGWKPPRASRVDTGEKVQQPSPKSPKKVYSNGCGEKKEEEQFLTPKRAGKVVTVASDDDDDDREESTFLHVLTADEHLKGKSGRPSSRENWLNLDVPLRDSAACFLVDRYLASIGNNFLCLLDHSSANVPINCNNSVDCRLAIGNALADAGASFLENTELSINKIFPNLRRAITLKADQGVVPQMGTVMGIADEKYDDEVRSALGMCIVSMSNHTFGDKLLTESSQVRELNNTKNKSMTLSRFGSVFAS